MITQQQRQQQSDNSAVNNHTSMLQQQQQQQQQGMVPFYPGQQQQQLLPPSSHPFQHPYHSLLTNNPSANNYGMMMQHPILPQLPYFSQLLPQSSTSPMFDWNDPRQNPYFGTQWHDPRQNPYFGVSNHPSLQQQQQQLQFPDEQHFTSSYASLADQQQPTETPTNTLEEEDQIQLDAGRMDTENSEQPQYQQDEHSVIHSKQPSILESMTVEQRSDWVNSIVGRGWEIYWEQDKNQKKVVGMHTSSKGNFALGEEQIDTYTATSPVPISTSSPTLTTTGAQNESASPQSVEHDDDEEDDWYDGTVTSFESTTSLTCPEETLYFNVRFLGDDEDVEHVMALTPETVRPSARVWTRRTLALLQQPSDNDDINMVCAKGFSLEYWEQALPADTSTVADQETLQGIRRKVETEDFPLILPSSFHDKISDATTAVLETLKQEHESCSSLISLMRQQMHLRSKLAFIETDDIDTPTDASTEDPDPSEEYLDFLVKCMEEVVAGMKWYHKCWTLFCRFFAKEQLLPNGIKLPMRRDTLLQEYLFAGRYTILSILSMMDTSPRAAKEALKRQKRPVPAQCISSTPASPASRTGFPRRRAKRRKTAHEGSDVWLVPEDFLFAAAPITKDVIDSEDGCLSGTVINAFVDQVVRKDRRWFTAYMGNMLRSVSDLLISKCTEWEKKAQFCLGEIDVSHEFSSDGESSRGDSDDDEISDEESERPGRYSVRYEDVENLLDASSKDHILKNLDLSPYTRKLQWKLEENDRFVKRAWTLISTVLDDKELELNGAREDDCIFQGLKNLIQKANDNDGPMANMNPIGQAASSLKRCVLESALLYREWYLDFRHAESARERLSFVENVVSRFSHLPPLPFCTGEVDLQHNASLDYKRSNLAPRVDALSRRFEDERSLFNRFQSVLLQRKTEETVDVHHSFDSLSPVHNALADLECTSVISTAEELLAVRCDVLLWLEESNRVFSSPKPNFYEITKLKKASDEILKGRSPRRVALIHGKHTCPEIDSAVKIFALADMEYYCSSLLAKVSSLFAISAAWKERAESVLNVLRQFGNPSAGTAATSGTKQASMIDVKRIEDLLSDYPGLAVDLSDIFSSLTEVRDAAKDWSTSVNSFLLETSNKFDDCLALLETMGKDRPKGIIVEPARHIVDALKEHLQWYLSLKECLRGDSSIAENHMNILLAVGLPVVELYARTRQTVPRFDHLEKSSKLFADKKDSYRTLSTSKLEANSLGKAVLARMINDFQDQNEGCPLCSLYFLLWSYYARDFLNCCRSRSKVSLADAKELLNLKPSIIESVTLPSWLLGLDIIRAFEREIGEAEAQEISAREQLAKSNGLLREASNNMDEVRSHLNALKDLHALFKGRLNPEGGITLDSTLEQLLDQHIKMFSWLVRTFAYPAFHPQIGSFQTIHEDVDTRVPWDVLVQLHERTPSSDLVLGDFACVAVRVKELYEAAKRWQDDISKLTMLSLRGLKRRTPGSPNIGEIDLNDPLLNTVDMRKVVELTNDEVLSQVRLFKCMCRSACFSSLSHCMKVAMPREAGIRTMLVNTQQFEIQLHQFLGVDYEGDSPDRVTIPQSGSLVGEDGTFFLFRLTESPIFCELVASVESISKIAGDVLANTPGKAAFEWIRQASEWIDSMRKSVVTNRCPNAGARFAIPSSVAVHLVNRGDQIFLNFPEDLRQILSKYKIFISTNKEGVITIKSRKGGAHHSVGIMCVRWCPFLLSGLKFDISNFRTWENSVMAASQEFISIREFASSYQQPNDPVLLQRYYRCRAELQALLDQCPDLVVSPAISLVENLRKVFVSTEAYIAQHGNYEAAMNFADSLYADGEAVTSNRHALLNALVGRIQLAPDDVADHNVDEISKNGPFRAAGRNAFTKALRKGAEILFLMEENHETVSALCSLKAWEIENALFDLYQGDLGEDKISDEYKEKARVLRRSLEDVGNVALFTRVLAGKISAEKLVNMSTEDLANPQVRKDREAATAVARQHIVLTGGAGKDTSQSVTVSESADVDTKAEAVSLNSVDECHSPTVVARTLVEIDQLNGSPPSLQDTIPTSPSNTNKAFTNLSELVRKKSGRQAPPPPPPPSLVMSLKPTVTRTTSSSTSSSSSGKLAKSETGGDEFILTLANHTRSFAASLVIESDPHSIGTQGFIQEELSEKGRVKIPDFTEFLRDKLWEKGGGGGEWVAAKFRLQTITDGDLKEYKKFYKEYETKQRVALITLTNRSNVPFHWSAFLVTPRFHRNTVGLSFDKPTSSYLVVLTKKL
jgi:hypothetical protein